jgi:hypothetical protein
MPISEHPSYFGRQDGRYALHDPGYLDHRIHGRKLSDRGVYTRFKNLGLPQLKVDAAGTLTATGGGAATGDTGDENRLLFPEAYFEYHILGAGQTILFPQKAAGGLDVALDQAEDEGLELTCGIESGCAGSFIVGTDAAFYAKLKFSIADVSGTDDCAFGFRKLEAYRANIDDYLDAAVLNVISGDIKIETILNNGATTTTDTTNNWADTETHTLEIYVSATGVVTYKIDGADPLVTAAFTFDTGDEVIPFFYMLHTGDFAGAVVLKEWDVDFQVPEGVS